LPPSLWWSSFAIALSPFDESFFEASSSSLLGLNTLAAPPRPTCCWPVGEFRRGTLFGIRISVIFLLLSHWFYLFFFSSSFDSWINRPVNRSAHVPSNILCSSRLLWIGVLSHVSAPSSASRVNVGFQSWGLEGDGINRCAWFSYVAYLYRYKISKVGNLAVDFSPWHGVDCIVKERKKERKKRHPALRVCDRVNELRKAKIEHNCLKSP